jgi:glycosyltransferase involved in cell wall biosynthesis
LTAVRPPNDVISHLRDIAEGAGVKRVNMLAWRDLDDPEAGGSEVHASTVASLWAEAGIEVTMRTSFAAGRPQMAFRDGYRVIRKAGRYLVFPRAAFSEMVGWHGTRDALVEIWNGMPFFSPIWARTPHVTWLHHVHDTMWEMTLPPRLARLGRTLEFKIAPPFYSRSPIITLSESSRDELISKLHFKAKRISVVPPGIDERFTPGGEKSDKPLVVAVGRLVPVKNFSALVRALIEAKAAAPALEAVIVGEGYERSDLEAMIAAAGAQEWLRMPGRVDEDEKIDLYRRAWVLASASVHEGWGMTITEAAACGTPAVVTRIAGHSDAVADGRSGLLVQGESELAAALVTVLCDPKRRAALTAGALAHAAQFTWARTASGTLQVLADEVRRKRRA